MTLVLVMLGGGLGAGLRYGVGLASIRLFGPGLPVGTLLANGMGSFAMGLLVGALALRPDGGAAARAFAGIGLLGGFTTFSTFSLDALGLWQRGDAGLALGYVLISLAVGLGGAMVGLRLAQGF